MTPAQILRIFFILTAFTLFFPSQAYADISVEIVKVQKRSDYLHQPMEYEDEGRKRTYYVLREPFVSINEVVSLALYYVSWTDRYGLFISLSRSGSTKTHNFISQNPRNLMGVVVNNRLVLVAPGPEFLRKDRVKTVAVYTKAEANDLIQAFLALGEEGIRFKNFAIIMMAAFFFILSSGVVVLGISVVRARVTRRRKKSIADESEENRKMREDDISL